MRTWFNSEEDAALQGLPILTQLIYLRAIRRFMDAETLVVGLKRRISYRSIIDTVYVEPNMGRQHESTTTKKVRVALGQLEKAGLIQPLGDHMPLVFKCPLAASDFQAQKKEGRPRAQKEGREKGRPDASNDAGLHGKRGREQGAKNSGFSEKEGTPQISKNINYYSPPVVPPENPMEWAQFFVHEFGFLIHEVQTAKTIPMFSGWVDQSVTVDEVRAAVESAHQVNNGRAGSPVFYRKFVEAELRKRGKSNQSRSKTNESSEAFTEKYGHVRVVKSGSVPV